MSFLDPLLTGEPTDLAPIEAQIAALQTVNAAQQTKLDALEAELEGFGDAQAAVDAIQTAAIAAAEAVNTAQSAAQATMQAAQDANAALDTTQAGAIVALQGNVGTNTAAITALQTLTGTHAAQIASLVANAQPMIEVDLRRFVPNGLLTNANIDDAIDAAIIAAMGATGPGFRGPAPVITCPPGIWTLARPHVFAGFPGDANRCFIGFRGAGMNETVFLANTDGTGTPVFTFGNASTPGVNPWIMYLFVSGFSIIAGVDENTVRTGVRIYCAVNPLITSIRVRGLNSANAQYDQGRGVEILPALGAGVEINSQFVVLKDCDLSVNMTGLYVRRSYPILIDNCHIQGNHFEDAIFDGCLGEWRNSGAQFQGDSTLYPDRWYGRRNMPGIVTGFSKTTGLAAGSGASCAAAVGNLSLVTLPGANLTFIDRGRWVRLTPGGASANEIKVRGMYKIDSVASPTTAWIRKGSNHTLQTGLAYQVCEAEPGSEMTFDHLYDEAVSRVACYGFYRDSAGTGVFVVKRPQAFIHGGYVFESDGPYRVRLEAPPVANVEKVARVRMTKESFVDATPDKIECDDYSHPGHASRSAWQKPFTGFIPSDERIAYAYRDSGGGNAVRLRTALQEMGFLEIWDARVTSSINIVGADARSWTGLLKGTVLGPTTGVLYPLYTPDDPLFGGPCITMVAGTHLTGRSFKGAIAAANLPATPYLCTIFTVARAENAAVPPGNELCRVQVSTPDANQFIAFNDGLWTGGVYGMNEGTTLGNALTAFTPAVDTDPHAYVFGRSPDGTNVISTDHGEDYRMHNAHTGGFAASHTPGANLDVVVGGVGATYSHRALRVTAVAVKVGTLSHAEARKLIDLSRNEWPLEA